MQRFIITLIFILLYILNLQGQWEVMNEGFRGSVTSLDFIDDYTGWLAGGNGMLFKTDDGGLTWHSISCNEELNFIKIDFLNELNGWAIGWAKDLESTLVLRTEDGGENWLIEDQQADIRYNFLNVLSDNVVIVGSSSLIRKTINGGLTWIDISPEPIDGFFNTTKFFSNEIGLAAGSIFENGFNRGLISRTVNGGSTWSLIVYPEFNIISNLQFKDNAIAYFIAERWEESREYSFCRTRDFGQHREIILQSPYPIHSYFLSNNDIIYVSASDSLYNIKLLKSIDDGRTWNSIFSLPNWQSSFIHLDEEDRGVILLQLFSPEGGRSSEQLIMSNRFNGKDWLIRNFSYNLTDICFVNPDLGFTVGGYSIFHGPTGGDVFSSLDGGVTWSPITSMPGWISSIKFASDSIGYLMTENWSFLMYKTFDFGIHWKTIYENNPDSTGYEFYGRDIFLEGTEKIWVAGSYWEDESSGAGIIFSSNGGKNWEFKWKYPNDEMSYYNLEALSAVNNLIWAIGSNGLIVKIVNQDSFQVTNYLTDLPLNAIHFCDEKNGWIAGGYGGSENFRPLLLKTIDGGDSWIEQDDFPYLVTDLFFKDSLQGWVVGSDQNRKGTILITTNGGKSWNRQAEHLPSELSAIDFIGDYGWAVGRSGLILKTDNRGASWIDDNNKKVYASAIHLEQNFPNPFNPKTIINYELPITNEVDLSIFNILGQKVVTLVSKKQSAGRYQVEWDASGFASGIYIYKLSAKNKAQRVEKVRKLILLK